MWGSFSVLRGCDCESRATTQPPLNSFGGLSENLWCGCCDNGPNGQRRPAAGRPLEPAAHATPAPQRLARRAGRETEDHGQAQAAREGGGQAAREGGGQAAPEG